MCNDGLSLTFLKRRQIGNLIYFDVFIIVNVYSIHLLGCYLQFNEYSIPWIIIFKKRRFSHSLSLSADEFILVACGNRILSGNVDGSDFVEVFTHDNDIKDVDFDPVNEKVYFTDGALHTVDTDGTNYKMLFPDVDRKYRIPQPPTQRRLIKGMRSSMKHARYQDLFPHIIWWFVYLFSGGVQGPALGSVGGPGAKPRKHRGFSHIKGNRFY